MANYNNLKTAIQDVIKANGNHEITGDILQNALLSMINSLGAGYQFMGVATPETNPSTPDQKVFYFANGKGTYANFGGLIVDEDEVIILYYDTAWHKLLTGIAPQEKLSELGQEVNGLITNQEIGVVQINQTYDLILPVTLEAGKRYIIHINSNSHLVSGATPAFYENTTEGHYDYIAIDTDVEVIPTTDVNKYVIYIAGNRVSSAGNIIITITNNHNISERVTNLEGKVNDIDSHILGKTIYDNLIAITASSAQYNLEFQPGVLLKKGWKYNVRINSDSIIDPTRDLPLYQSYSGGAYTTIRVNKDNIITINEDTTELIFYVAANWVLKAGNVEVFVTDVGVDNSIVTTIDNVEHLKSEVIGGELYRDNFAITASSAQYNLYFNPFVILKKGWKYIVRINNNSVIDSGRNIPLYESYSGGTYHSITPNTDTEITIEDNDTTGLMFYVAENWVAQEGTIEVIISTNGITETEALKIEKNNYDDSLSMSVFTEIGVCGDSYSVGYIKDDSNNWILKPEISWGKQLGRLFNIDVSLFGRAGISTRTYLTDSNCLPALLAAPAKQLYLLNLGINDASSVTLGTIADIHEDYTKNPDTFYGNYGRIIAQIQEHAPNAKIVMIKVLAPTYSDAGYSWSSAAIEEIAQHYNIPFLETLDSEFLASPWFVNNCSSNGGHPTAIGLSGAAKAISRLLQKAMMTNYYSYFEHYYPHQ